MFREVSRVVRYSVPQSCKKTVERGTSAAGVKSKQILDNVSLFDETKHLVRVFYAQLLRNHVRTVECHPADI